MGVDQAVVKRVEELLGKTELGQNVKERIRDIARGEAGKAIGLGFCDLRLGGAQALAEALKNSSHVERINLWDNDIGPDGARAVAEGLKHVGNLQTLGLWDNNLGPDGARAVAEGLKHVGNLETLYLLNNNLGPDGARAVAERLKHVGKLQTLNLQFNDIGPDGARAVAEGLKHVGNLETLFLRDNNIGPDGARAVAEGLKHVGKLQRLFLGSNNLGPDGARAVAEGLKHVGNLQALYLYGNNLGPDGARAVAEGLKHVGKLQTLDLENNNIGPDGARAIGAVLPRDREFRVLFSSPEERKAFDAARPATAPVHHDGDDDNEDDDCDGGSSLLQQHMSGEEQKPSATKGKKQQKADTQDPAMKQLRQQLKEKEMENKQLSQHLTEKENECKQLDQQLKKEKASVKALNKAQKKRGTLLKQKEEDMASLKAANEHLTQELKEKDARIAQLTQELQEKNVSLASLAQNDTGMDARIEQLEQQFKQAEAALNLNIQQSRFTDMKKARNHKGKVIKGSYGTLYTAKLGGHRVALKQIDDVDARPHLAEILKAPDGANDEEDKRLYREALILLSIRHPNIVSFLGLSHDDDDSTLSFVLSWAEGGSLYEHLHVHGRQLTKPQCARIAMEVAGAVRFLHAHGIVHRDLKSPNVLLDGSLSAKVTDFGLSAFKRGDDKTLTHQKGTPLWASPEQLLELKLYADTDVFSFGVLYWELCFNCKPWHHKGKSASTANIMFAYKGKEYLPVDEEVNGVMLSAAEQQLLGGCFDVSGNRLDFTQLHTALRELYNAAAHHQQLDEKQQTKMLFGAEDAVWKFPRSLLEAVKAVTKRLSSRPAVSIAPLDLKRDVDAVNKLLAEAGGPTAEQPNALKPFSHTLAAVAITHDKQKEAAFNGALARNRTRYRGHLTSGSSHPFSPKYDHNTSTKEPTNEEEKQVLRRVTCGTVYNLLDPSLLQEDPPLRLQRVFHGVTSWKAVVGILGGDFAALQQLDGGWYGAGFYFTPDLDYALAYAKPCTDSVPPEIAALGVKAGTTCRVVLACDVQYGNPYPVLDAKKFNGKPLESGHDAHMAVADFSSGGVFDAKPFPSHKEWTKQGKKPVAEIAMNDPSCVLVRAVLVFEA